MKNITNNAIKRNLKLKDFIIIIAGLISLAVTPLIAKIGLIITESNCIKNEYDSCTFATSYTGNVLATYVAIGWGILATTVIIIGFIVLFNKSRPKSKKTK